jgi:glycosyltransferase involved in cell wall biosynthesis
LAAHSADARANDKPTFTVVVPTYNRADTLPRALESVLTQSYENLEIVVVDDGSTDTTSDLLEHYDDPRLRVVSQPNGGVSAARNAGAAVASGAYLVFLDSDDELLPDALHIYAQMRPGTKLAIAPVIAVSPDGTQWSTIAPDRDLVLRTRFTPFLAAGFAIEAATFAEIGGYDAGLRYSENTELAWRMRAQLHDHGAMEILDRPAAIVRRRPERGHDQSRYDAARSILERRSYEMEIDRTGRGATSEFRANYLAIAGVSAARLGRRREALTLAARAVAAEPFNRARYRTLASVGRTVLRRNGARRDAASDRADSDRAVDSVTHAGRVHGVIVTFRRPEQLRRAIKKVSAEELATLTIVDNAPNPETRAAADTAPAAFETHVLPMSENVGPAGGLASGIEHVLSGCADEDWILVLNDDEVPAGDGRIARLHAFAEWLVEHGAAVGAIGLTGARFDRRHGTLLRPQDRELSGPVTVDYVAGNQLMMISARAARLAGTFDPQLFFGFEELDCCLRLQRAGFGVFLDGPLTRETREAYGRVGDAVEAVDRPNTAWRRYYSVRNRIVIMRRSSSAWRAFVVTLSELFGRPLADLRRRRPGRVALARAGARACADAWLGRLGRRVDPSDDEEMGRPPS